MCPAIVCHVPHCAASIPLTASVVCDVPQLCSNASIDTKRALQLSVLV